MRIGYLHPLAADMDAALRACETAAKFAGAVFTILEPESLTEDSPFDLLISFSPALRKTTSHPTFLADNQPRSAFFEAPGTFANLASYDGYLCISDKLSRFFTALAAALDKPIAEPGAFYPLLAVGGPQADLLALAASGHLKLGYGGADSHIPAPVLRRLQAEPGLIDLGVGDYSACGVGLVWPAQDLLIDGVAPQALFDIGSAGACAICPDMAWIRNRLGDDVYYYPPFAAPGTVMEALDLAMADIVADPAAAQIRALAAQSKLKALFAPDIQIAGLLNYYKRWTSASQERTAALGSPLIDVIMRVGGRPRAVVERAVASLKNQTAGRLRLILAAYAPIDLSWVSAAGRIAEVVVISSIGANRARNLTAGLAQVRSPYFCVLDDDDYLLAGHMAGLLEAMNQSQDSFCFAYSDVLCLDQVSDPPGRISLLKSGPAQGDIFNLLSRLPSHCFLATSNILTRVRYAHWNLSTAEDGLLIGALLRWATPLHSANATAVYCQGSADSSGFLQDAQRCEDELLLFTEIADWRQKIESRFPLAAPGPEAIIGPLARQVIEDGRRRISQDRPLSAVGEWLSLESAAIDVRAGPLWGEDIYSGALVDEPLVFLPIALDGGRAEGASVSAAKERGAVVLKIKARQPWEVALRIDVADYAIPGCSTLALAVLACPEEALTLALVNPQGEALAKSDLPPGIDLMAALVSGPAGQPLDAVILQAGPAQPTASFQIKSLKLGYRLSELRDVLGGGDPGVSREGLLERLQAVVSNQVLNRPAVQPDRFTPVNFRTPACVFRRVIKDGPLADGAPRIFTSGAIAWDYFAQVHVPGRPGAEGQWLKIIIRNTMEPFYAFLVDERFESRLSDSVTVAAGKGQVEIWLPVPSDGAPAYLIFQAADAPGDLPLTLVSVQLSALGLGAIQ